MIEIAKKHADLDNYELVSYPKLKDPFEALMEELSINIESRVLNKALGNEQKYYKKIQNVTQQSGIMTRMAFDIDIH